MIFTVLAVALAISLAVFMLVNITYTGVAKPSNGIVAQGDPEHYALKIESATNMYAGRLVTPGTAQHQMNVCSNILPPIGWLGYEHTEEPYVPTTVDTIYTVNHFGAVLFGGKFCVVGSLAKGFTCVKGDLLCNWAAGEVAPCAIIGGSIGIKIPFSQNASETDTSIDLPTGMLIKDVLVRVVTAVASGTIDIGILSSESGGDADGLADGVSCASAGLFRPKATLTAGTNETYYSATTRGALLRTFLAGGDTATDVGTYEEKAHETDGTAKSITYTTSAHAIAGFFYVVLEHPNLQIVGRAEADGDASSAAVDLVIRSLI